MQMVPQVIAQVRARLDDRLGDRPDQGATMVEYSIMVVLIAAVAFLTIAALGIQVDALFQSAVDQWP